MQVFRSYFGTSLSVGSHNRYLSVLITGICWFSLQVSVGSHNRYLSVLITDICRSSLQVSVGSHYRYVGSHYRYLSVLITDICLFSLQAFYVSDVIPRLQEFCHECFQRQILLQLSALFLAFHHLTLTRFSI